MKLTIVAFLILGTFLQKVQSDDAGKCDTSTCLIENNCRCSMLEGPLTLEETPQLIVLAFASAAKEDIYQKIWSPLVMARKNPDGEFISANFYINHEYSDYQIVHDLAVNGFEIGVHSVTNTVDQEYWRNATEELLEQEFGDQRKIMAKFANIPADKIRGTLTPQLQLNGDSSTTAFAKQGFTYDNSWPSKTHLYPYTLDYASGQDCTLGTKCPTQSYPGFWVAPIIDLQGQDGDVCATIFGCFRNSSE
ncbi:hypothetical protein ABEB36_003781 [Hypothenemus hampei]|uniref:Chitin deacetylase n=1 Tax=Hypothenemus hampei TaxID=57062 RepID=A0ABD1F1G9_HYPHA